MPAGAPVVAGDPVAAGVVLAGAEVVGVADALGVADDAVGVGDAGGVLCCVVAGADVLAVGVAGEVLGRAVGVVAGEEVCAVTAAPDFPADDGCPEAAKAAPPATDAARTPVITAASVSLRPIPRR